MPSLPTRRQQPTPVSPQVPVPNDFPAIPEEVLARFPSAADWQRRLNDFWARTNQALQQAQMQTARQVNSSVVYSVDRFLIYAGGDVATPMFALDGTGIRLGNVLVINTPGRKVYIGEGVYADDGTPFYIDTDGKFSLGANLTWDPDTSTLTITGIINATSGTIGGFTIGADYIRDVANSFGLASTVTGGNDVRFWAGSTFANRANAEFKVYENGAVVVGSGPASGEFGIQIIKDVDNGSSGGAIALIAGSITTLGDSNDLYGLYLEPDYAPDAATVGQRAYGQYIGVNQNTGGGVIATAYGLYISTVNIGATNWGIYSATTVANYFGGLTTFNLGLTTPAAIVSTLATGTAPFTIASTTVVGNLNVSQLLGGTWAIPGTIGSTTPNSGVFTSLKATALAGVGTRNVVVDAAGVMSAP